MGYANVDRLARSLTAKQFAEWEHYAMLEPFDETRADYRAASIREMIFNMAVSSKDRKALDYFVLKFGAEPEAKKKARKQSVDEQLAVFKIMAMMGGMKG